MELDPAQADRRTLYQWLIGCVVPRPIAWITTLDEQQRVNLAPFSFFNGVTASPPVVSVAIAYRDPMKDTLRNVLANREAVIHLAPPDAIAAVHQSGGEYAAQVSEVLELNLATIPSTRVRPPRLREAQVAMECRLLQTIPVGTPSTTLCLFEIIHLHVAEAVLGHDGLPDATLLRAPARLGGRNYLGADAWTVIEMPVQHIPADKRRSS
jgi:flavin reductase (DIM6/NTAB) family NADH-FMN oxidoreductase RutF